MTTEHPLLSAFAGSLMTLVVLLPAHALAQQSDPAPPSVIVQAIEEKDVTPEFRYVGRVVATDTVSIRARVQGTLEARNFVEGSIVEKGQLLFSIEKPPYEVVVDQRKAELASAKATVVNATADFTRQKSLEGQEFASEAKLDQAKAAKLTAEADVLKAEAALRAAELDLGYTNLTSPITGKISTANYSVGNLVSANSDPLATVTSMDPVYVTIGVSEKDMLETRKRGIDLKNPPVAPTLRLSDGSSYDQPGAFNYLSPDVNQSTDTIVARAQFANPKGILLPGQFVTVVIRPKETERSIVVPQVAVQRDGQGYYVLVIDRENKVEVRRIEADRQVGTDWVVSSGLVTGERVIVDGIQKVRPAMVVNPVKAT